MSAINWDANNSTIRIIDRNNSTPTLVYDILANQKHARLVMEDGDGIVPTAVLYLNLDTSGTFNTAFPILTDKDAPQNYLIEAQIAQNVGGVIKTTDLQRYRLSTPTIVENTDLGVVMQVPLEHIAQQALNENIISLNEELVTPKKRIEDLISYYNAQNLSGVFFGNVTVNLPDDESLKRDYIISSPISLEEAFREVIEILNEAPPLGGTFKNYYWKIKATSGSTNSFDILFEEFGLNNTNVTINSTTIQGTLLDRTGMTSNKKRRNVVVVKFHPRGHALPTEHTLFASKFQHAKFRPEWESGKSYVVGDLVKFTHTSTIPYTIRFFRCKQNVTSATNPDQDATSWQEDFTVIPPWSNQAYYTQNEIVTRNVGGATIRHYRCTSPVGPTSTPPESAPGNWTQVFTDRIILSYTAFQTYTPWTNNVDIVKASMADSITPPLGYIGYMVDWNYRRQINDLKDYTNRFTLVTGRDVDTVSNTPPTGRDLFNGKRVLVGTSPSGAFAGQANRIAEYVSELFGPSSWKFSDAPQTGDTIFNWNTANLLRWNGSAWVSAWNPENNNILDPNANDRPGPAHIVKDIRLVKGATDIPGQAVELRFNWNLDPLTGGSPLNRTSAGAWYCVRYPLPRRDVASYNLGQLYGGNGTDAPTNTRVNHQNMNQTRYGKIGWNRGTESEDYGRLSEHMIKLRASFFKSTDDSVPLFGKTNVSATYWRVDRNGRIFFKDFIIPFANEWFMLKVTLPPFGPSNLYFNRLDELARVLGYTLPIQLPLQEKNYSGVQYEFRHNDAWGFFLRDNYQQNGMYVGPVMAFFNQVESNLNQIIPTTLEALYAAFKGDSAKFTSLILAAQNIDHVWLAVDEDHYIKEGYAIFPPNAEANARIDLFHMEQETDYLTAVAKAESIYYRDTFFPNERYVSCTGNVDIQYGKLVVETGPRVPGGTVQSVIARNKITVDNRGFNHELYLVRKFTIV